MSKTTLTYEQWLDPEVRYWSESGFEQGTARYDRYLALFSLAPSSLRAQWVLDLGCGPFGGMFSVLEDVGRPFAVDLRAHKYNTWGLSPVPILAPDAYGRFDVPAESIDSAFCLDVLGRTEGPRMVATELSRLVRRGGLLYFFSRISRGTKKYPPFRLRHAGILFGQPPARRLHHLRPTKFSDCWRWGWFGKGLDRIDLDHSREHAIWGILERT